MFSQVRVMGAKFSSFYSLGRVGGVVMLGHADCDFSENVDARVWRWEVIGYIEYRKFGSTIMNTQRLTVFGFLMFYYVCDVDG